MKTKNMSLKLLAILIVVSLISSCLLLTSCDEDLSSDSSSSNSSSKSSSSESKSSSSKSYTSTPTKKVETEPIEDDDEDEDDDFNKNKYVEGFVIRWNNLYPKNPIKDKQIKYYEDGNGPAGKVTIDSIVCEFSGYEGHPVFSILSKKLPLTENGRKKFLNQATKAFAAYYALKKKEAESIIDAFSNGKAGKRSDYMSYSYKNIDLTLDTTAIEGYNYRLFTDKDGINVFGN